MISPPEVWFWGSAGLTVYAVVGYPLVVAILSRVVNRPVRRADILPSVDIVIPVHNGEAELEEKLRNCLALEYPAPSRTIWVVSDGSTDRTAAIARSFGEQGIRCLEIHERVGKVEAQNRLLPRLAGEIVVFTDVSIRARPDALRLLVSNFADPEVAVVSCRDQVPASRATESGESLYIRYDMFVRSRANRLGSLIGVTGGLYAVRRELTQGGWDPAYPPDFHAALCAIENGQRAVEDERVLAFYTTTPSPRREFERKVRTMTRGMWALLGHRRLLNPLRYPGTALQLVHHKLMRWWMPFFLLSLLLANVVLSWQRPWPFLALGLAHGMVYLLGALALGGKGPEKLAELARGPAFLLLFNAALLLAWWNLVTRRRFEVWAPTARAQSGAS